MDQRRHEVRLLDRETCGSSLGMFRFDRPDGYAFTPGQFASVTLSTRDGDQTKSFTHSQAPADPYLEVTTRLTGSAFKDALSALRPGDTAAFTGPRGRLAVPPDADAVAFLVGGVGITPARSIIRDAVLTGTGPRILLFYGNMEEECIPFREELDGYAAGGRRLTVVHVIAHPAPGWDGETGFITAGTVGRHAGRMDDWHWIIAGPPAMNDAMLAVAGELGIPEDRISAESFVGYE